MYFLKLELGFRTNAVRRYPSLIDYGLAFCFLTRHTYSMRKITGDDEITGDGEFIYPTI